MRRPPLVMGHEFAGTVERCGPNVEEVQPGDAVTVNPLLSCGRCRFCLRGERQRCPERRIIGIDVPGAFAEWVVVPARQCYPVSDVVGGALVEPLACAVRAVGLARVEFGDDVAVVGAGIIGLMVALLARRAGARRVAVVDPQAPRRDLAPAWGATDTAATVEALTEQAGRWAFDRVIDAVGFGSTRRVSMALLRRGGRAVWIGLHEAQTALDGNAVVRDETEVVGSFCYTDEEFLRAVRGFNDGDLLPRPRHWMAVRPLDAGPAAFRELTEGRAAVAKVILAP